jgi:hypothetical protein
VRSSVRRFVKSFKESVKHYTRLKTGFKDIFINVIRPSKYPFKKILGLTEPDFYLATSIIALINIINLL